MPKTSLWLIKLTKIKLLSGLGKEEFESKAINQGLGFSKNLHIFSMMTFCMYYRNLTNNTSKRLNIK